MRFIPNSLFLSMVWLVTINPAAGQSADRPDTYFDISAEYNQPLIVESRLQDVGGRAGYAISFTALRLAPIGKRCDLEFGLGGSIRRLVQYVENVGRSGPNDVNNLVGVDMESTAILLRIPIQVRYYFRPGGQGMFLRAGVSVVGELREKWITTLIERSTLGSTTHFAMRCKIISIRYGAPHRAVGARFGWSNNSEFTH